MRILQIFIFLGKTWASRTLLMVLYQKKRKLDIDVTKTNGGDKEASSGPEKRVVVRFVNSKNEEISDEVDVPTSITSAELLTILRVFLPEGDARLLEYSLVLSNTGQEIASDLATVFENASETINTEETLRILFYTKCPFAVRPITRLTDSLKGHRGTIICGMFSPDSSMLATGSGDCTVRLWNIDSATPICTFRHHTAPVVCLAWSPDCRYLATGSEDRTIRVWDVTKCSAFTDLPEPITLNIHKDAVTCLEFMPVQLHEFWPDSQTSPLLSAGRDGSVRITDIINKSAIAHLDGHTKMITAVKWSGVRLRHSEPGPFVYTASRDMTLRLWKVSLITGRVDPLLNIRCHGHWINALSCNTDSVLRLGAYDPSTGVRQYFASYKQLTQAADERWAKVWADLGQERVVTCSDDNTLSLWNLMEAPKDSNPQPLTRMLGHQKAVCSAKFSPNGRYIVSAGFDSSLKLWDGRSGKFLHTYRGHVGPVYQISWAADSRLFVSCSRDSTLKLWDTIEGGRKLKEDLPGASDEIYATDWSPDCSKVASGGKDKILRIWSH